MNYIITFSKTEKFQFCDAFNLEAKPNLYMMLMPLANVNGQFSLPQLKAILESNVVFLG